MASMTQGAVTAQKDAEIEALREALSNRGEHGITTIPVDQITPLQINRTIEGKLELIRQPRKYFDPEELNLLVESIRNKGLNEPVAVRPLGDGKYGLLDGERRWRAHQLLEKTLIEAVVVDCLTDEDALEWALATDTLKASVSSLEQTLSVVNLLSLRLNTDESGVRKILNALNNREQGKTSIDVPEEYNTIIYGVLGSLGLKLGSLVARLPLLDLPEYLSQRVEEGELSPTNALLISRAPEELHDSLISEGGKLSKQKLRELIKRSTNEEAPQPDTQTQPTDLQKRFKSALRKVDKTDAWNNPQKSQQLEKLLQQIEKLLS
jgi:ParB family chromosome partitioning protein